SRRHFVDRVRALLDDPAFGARLGEHAREVAKEYLWSNRIDTFEEIHGAGWASTDGVNEE
ncbi:MAG: hypothetical protein V5A27_04905, partial [Halapricum sp.]